jgi:hypothetical protein
MSSPTIDTSNSLVIQTHSKLTIGDIPVEIISYLGQTADVHYFQVNILPPDDSTIKTNWQIASGSTVGLSPHRLHNEDNYGVIQEQLSNSQTMILAVVADGMGGMSHGEGASDNATLLALKCTIQKKLELPIQ